MKKTLEAAVQSGQLQLTPAQIGQLCQYGAMLLEKNRVMNLTAITEPEAVAQLHFLDCLALLQLADFGGKKVIDIGCGAGFPGIPLLIAQPDLDLTLLDSTAKRIGWRSASRPGRRNMSPAAGRRMRSPSPGPSPGCLSWRSWPCPLCSPAASFWP